MWNSKYTLLDGRENNQSFSLGDVLKSGFAIYSLKSPSLLSFQKRGTEDGGKHLYQQFDKKNMTELFFSIAEMYQIRLI
jgi:hypothetical protein